MRHQGKIIKWDDDKGFGFIAPNSGGNEVFLHISAFSSARKRPEINELVSYSLDKDKAGRTKANNVLYVIESNNLALNEGTQKINPIFVTFMLLFLAFIIERSIKGYLPHSFPFIFIGANLIVFLYYYQDKTAAKKHQWRTSENTLHFFSLIGGWGGAYIAQKVFRHKYKKAEFMTIYALTVFIHCALIIVFSIPTLQNILLSKLNSLLI